MQITRQINDCVSGNITLSELENQIKSGDYDKLSFSKFESIINNLFSTPNTQIIKLLNSYYSKLVGANSNQFYHLIVMSKPTATCREMIQNYKIVYMYNRYLDCSDFLINWSPTEAYFPLLLTIQQSNPDKPIDYTYWLERFSELPTALKFLKDNSIPIEFTDKKDLQKLYKTIPQQYIQDFLNLLGTKSWYIDVIKDTDHFLEEVEDWEG